MGTVPYAISRPRKIGTGVVHAQSYSDLAEALSARGEESAQQATGSQFLEPGLPGLGAAAQPGEDPC
jgi:hypothetical protein